MKDPLAPYGVTAPELRERVLAERGGFPLLVYRGPQGEQRLLVLDPETTSLTIGRAPTNSVPLAWDDEVSRVHAQLELVGGAWTMYDDGLSRNGTRVNGEPLVGRHRLDDGDLIQVGQTVIGFRAPGLVESGTTAASEGAGGAAFDLSPAQRRVLVALARPYKDLDRFATPASNQDIADELYLSVDAVKSHLRALFLRFHIEDLPQNQKRARLVELAFATGTIFRSEL